MPAGEVRESCELVGRTIGYPSEFDRPPLIVHSDVTNVLSVFNVGVEHVVGPTPVVVVVHVVDDTCSTLVDSRRDHVRIETDKTGIHYWMEYSCAFPHLGRTVGMCHTTEQSIPIV